MTNLAPTPTGHIPHLAAVNDLDSLEVVDAYIADCVLVSILKNGLHVPMASAAGIPDGTLELNLEVRWELTSYLRRAVEATKYRFPQHRRAGRGW